MNPPIVKLDGYPALLQEALQPKSIHANIRGLVGHLLITAGVAALGLR